MGLSWLRIHCVRVSGDLKFTGTWFKTLWGVGGYLMHAFLNACLSAVTSTMYSTSCCNRFVVLEFESIYERLGVTLLERGESFYQPFMQDIVKDFEAKGTVCRCG